MERHGRLKQFWQSFTGRMIFGLLAIQIFLTLLLFYGIMYFIEHGFQSQFIDQARNNTHLYAALMEPAVVDEDVPGQMAILNDAFLNEDLILAEFIHPDGTVTRPDSDMRFAGFSFEEDFEFDQHEDRVYYIAAQLFSDTNGELLGSLRLGYDELPTLVRIDTAYRYGSFVAASYAVLSILLVIFFGRRLTRPISQLQLMARSIATGDQGVGLNVSTNILEIGNLTKDLDSMRQTLVDRHREVKDREERLSAILDHAGEGIISFDIKGVIESFNKAAELMFGYSVEQVLGKKLSLLVPSPDRNHHDSDIKDYLETGETKLIGIGQRLQARHQDGHLFPVYLTVTEIHQGLENTYIGIIHDLTQEEEKERQLLQFWRAVEQSPVSIIITSVSGMIEYVNPHFCQVTGYRSEEVIGANPSILKSGNTQADVYRQLWMTIANGGIWRGVLQNRKKNGELFWESATICPVQDQNNQITHYIALKEDITEHRNKELMLTQSMKMGVIGRMTDGIAHDFNNLLTIILGNLELLMEDIRKDKHEEIMELAADALSAAQDGSDLIEQLLVFSRREQPDPRPTQISSFMASLQRLFSRTLRENIAIGLDVTEGIGSVLIDSNRLESAILNLLVNAQDAMPDGGKLKISIDKTTLLEAQAVDGGYIAPGHYISISVADDGAGMTEDVRQQALEPFFTTKTGAGGTGLGLSMVNDLVTQSGGGLRIESEPGKGTTVTLLLPLYEQAADFLTEDLELLKHLPGGNETILLVEDREKVRRFASRVLSRLGYRLLEAENAAEALKHLQTNREIDLLFTDIVMPGEMDGRNLAAYISSRKSSLKILLTTGMEFQLENDSSLSQDFPLLRKPYSAEQLAQSIRSVLNKGP